MKKQFLASLVTIALVATLVLSNMGILPTKGMDVEDEWSDMYVSAYISDSEGNDIISPNNWVTVEDGYFYCYFKLRPSSHIGETVKESVIIEPIGASSDTDLPNIEYRTSLEDTWADAKSVYVDNSHTLLTSKSEYRLYFRLSASKAVTFGIKYVVKSLDETMTKETKYRYVRFDSGYAMFTQTESNIYNIPIPTTEGPSVEPTTEETSVTPTTEETSVEPSTDESTVAPTTSAEPTVAPSTVEPSTVAPSTEPVTESTAQPTTVAPTSTVVPTVTVEPSVEPTTEETTAESTSVQPTTRQPVSTQTTTKSSEVVTSQVEVKAPGKAAIKKVGKKKRSAKKLKVTLKATARAKGYQVSVYKSKKHAKKHIKALVTKYTTKLKIKIKSKKLAKKKKLFVGARAYVLKSDGTKLFGAWSKTKKVKIK